MSIHPYGVRERGVSIIAALVFAGILAAVAGAIQMVSAPEVTLSQSAVVAVSATTAPIDPKATCQPGYDYAVLIKDGKTEIFPLPICAKNSQDVSGTTEAEQSKAFTNSINSALSFAGSAAGILKQNQLDSDAPGTPAPGKFTIFPDTFRPSGVSVPRCAERTYNDTNGQPIGKQYEPTSDKDWQCRKLVCDVTGGKVSECSRSLVTVGQSPDTGAKPGTATAPVGDDKQKALLAKILDPNTKQSDIQKLVAEYKQGGGDTDALNNVFRAEDNNKINRQEEVVDAYDKIVNGLALDCRDGRVTGEKCDAIPAEKAKLEQEMTQLQTDRDRLALAANQVSLCADTNGVCPVPLPVKRPVADAGGCASADCPPPPRTPCTGPICPPAGGTPPPQQRTGFGDGNPAGGLGGLGSGLGGGGQGGGQRGSGQGGGQQGYPPQQQYPQQQCQPQYYCQNNTIYYRQCQQQQQNNYGGYGSGYSGYGGSGGYSDQPYQQCPQGYQCTGQTCQKQTLWGFGTDGQPCPQPPQQPAATSCTTGVWVATSATNNTCTTGWQCKPNPATPPTAPTATLTCAPRVADVGMQVGFNFSCANATASSALASGGATAFSTGNLLSGTASTTTQLPSDGSNRITYTLTCTKGDVTPAQTASATCDVQTGKPSIVMVAVPQKIKTGEQSTIGWVTSGQQSCTVSDPDFATWTQEQASNTSVNGGVTTPAIPQGMTETTVTLTCKTVGGATKTAFVKLLVI